MFTKLVKDPVKCDPAASLGRLLTQLPRLASVSQADIAVDLGNLITKPLLDRQVEVFSDVSLQTSE